MIVGPILCLALNMYHEARGEGIDGIIAVGEVTINRVESPNYPNTVCEVVTQRKQFSWYRKGGSFPPIEEEDLFYEIVQIADELLEGKRPIENEATHFHSTSVNPYWSSQLTQIAKIGNHVFYRQ